MTKSKLPLPVASRQYREHEVAEAGRVDRLLEAIPEQTGLLDAMKGRHLLSAAHLDRELVMQLLRQAAIFEQTPRPHATTLNGQILVNAFLEQPVNRTRYSFESAAYSLGASVIDVDHVPTGHADDIGAMVELAEIFNSYGDAVVLRTSDREGFDAIVRDSQIPVINGGNGDLENPSQALVDLYTLFKWRPALMFPDVDESEKLQVGVFGAPGHTRTVHSLLILMSLFPWAFSRIVIFGRVSKLFKPGQREQLEEAGLNIVTTAEMYKQETMFGCLTKELPRMDVMYSHLLKPLDLSKIDREMAVSTLKPNAMVLCPAVHMKEFGGLLDDSSNNGYFCQARNAVYVRMAVIKAILD